ncbi:MAG: PVC-type heme-binding CxxCH protein [Planctomycetota bacterium]
MIAGKPSHGYGAHEHYAGLKIIEESLRASDPELKVRLVRGWPDDESIIDAVDSIVIYCDGGKRHLALPHRKKLAEKIAAGCGFACLHYAVEVPTETAGEDWVNWLGGNFETNYSVNPHWVARFESFPDHPVAKGVQPFECDDEWYFHLRLKESDSLKPILAAVAPETTMRRADGPHSGNPLVRKSVANGDLQTVAWVYDRPDGGRSFGFTGGHHHWNWANENVLRVVTNGIRWTAKRSIDEEGSETSDVHFDRLLKDQDYDQPKSFSESDTKSRFKISDKPADDSSAAVPRLLDATALITTTTSRHRVDLQTPITGVKDLFLVVTDGGNGYECDWADWVDPTLVGPAGTLPLVNLEWVSATSGFGKPNKNANCVGDPIAIREGPIGQTGIGVHASSVIHYRLPEGYETFNAIVGIDKGGTDQRDGQATSVRFLVFADALPPDIEQLESRMFQQQRNPENAIAGIQMAEGLEATLVASEPKLRSLTNLDVDHRGRIWVCDVMNYRHREGSRPEGDRILILEDTTGDGIADSVKTYYQGNDINSAMGICVLGDEVIVTATPNVWRFTDEDGDDIPDRKEAMFKNVGQPQHDHSAHSFLFGDDGKLYWNFGNTGQQVKNANDETVVDIHGRPVVDDGSPFYGGMPFRCDLDGSNFEVLAHNFRNNWETTVDSFGTIWQSDNDDDGNRATRINFVMEQGNYGYRDELTGASWREHRINMENEIPLRHWHLNDPGVVPNVLQTGAGSPSGICLYEGRLLPKRFWDQVIHCDPGPNVVRAYPMTKSGAGYAAVIEPIMTGVTDRWFRPADVCVAPDGSLFVSDWYDPGVGGHRQGDGDRGRLFRIAPPGSRYQIPRFDFDGVSGAVDALRNPNRAVRYKAWQSLRNHGPAAESKLLELYSSENPRLQARALWALGKLTGRADHYIQLAISDQNPNLRIVGVRLAKQLGRVPSSALKPLMRDPAPEVRREVALALRFDQSESMPAAFAELANQYDGEDRWMLEALGIASDLRAEECFSAWLKRVNGDWDHSAGRDLVWRIRAPQAASAMASLIGNTDTPLIESSRYFRSLEYHPADLRSEALRKVLASPNLSDTNVVRALQRMDDDSYHVCKRIKDAVARHIRSVRETAPFLDLAQEFRPDGIQDRLMNLVIEGESDSDAVKAMRLITSQGSGWSLIEQSLLGEDATVSRRISLVLGLLGNRKSVALLSRVAADPEYTYARRSEAIRGMSLNNFGCEELLDMAETDSLPADTRLLAGGLLASSQDESVKSRAIRRLPQPLQSDKKPLLPLDQLARLSGDAESGKTLFRTVATCSNCHVVDGHGKQVGPDLSEIGSKLPREAMLTSILDPSAGISHNYENHVALLDSGRVITGVLISQTDQKVILRTAQAVDHEIEKATIEELQKSPNSIMPENLHHAMDQQGLIDVVEYLMSLKKKGV